MPHGNLRCGGASLKLQRALQLGIGLTKPCGLDQDEIATVVSGFQRVQISLQIASAILAMAHS
jgi:hypothetical protein